MQKRSNTCPEGQMFSADKRDYRQLAQLNSKPGFDLNATAGSFIPG